MLHAPSPLWTWSRWHRRGDVFPLVVAPVRPDRPDLTDARQQLVEPPCHRRPSPAVGDAHAPAIVHAILCVVRTSCALAAAAQRAGRAADGVSVLSSAGGTGGSLDRLHDALRDSTPSAAPTAASTLAQRVNGRWWARRPLGHVVRDAS
jgi:hypothetical protein